MNGSLFEECNTTLEDVNSSIAGAPTVVAPKLERVGSPSSLHWGQNLDESNQDGQPNGTGDEEQLNSSLLESKYVIDNLKQEIFSLERKLEVCKRQEIDFHDTQLQMQTAQQELQHEFDQAVKHHKEEIRTMKCKHNEELQSCRSMITELNTEARTAEAECEKKDDRIKSLEELVEALRQQTASSAQNNSSVHDVSSTTATDDFLKLQSEYLELVEEFDKLSSDHRLLQIEHQNAEEGRLSAEKDSMEHYNALEGAKQQLRDMEVEMEMLQLDAQDPNRRGNSLFGEVDDRRKIAEKKMMDAEKNLKIRDRAYRKLSGYTSSLQSQIHALLSNSSRKQSDESILSLQMMCSMQGKELEQLQKRNSELQAEMEAAKSIKLGEELRLSVSSSDGASKYLKDQLSKMQSKLEKLGRDYDHAEMSRMALYRSNAQLQSEVALQKISIKELKNAWAKDQLLVTQLKLKYCDFMPVQTKMLPSFKEKLRDENDEEVKENKGPLKEKNTSSSDNGGKVPPPTNKKNNAASISNVPVVAAEENVGECKAS